MTQPAGNTKTVLVTGGSGFIGKRLVDALLARDVEVMVLTRRAESLSRLWPNGRVRAVEGDLEQSSHLSKICQGVDAVYHLASYAHASHVPEEQAANAFRRVIIDGTRAILESALAAGVKSFVFVSSVKAMGEGGASCLDETSQVAPQSAYGRAKLSAEQAILAAGQRNGMHVAIIRLPMVYGRDNKGNLPRMIESVGRGHFPPLPEVHNKRSMVHVQDVVQALLLAAESPSANGRVYIVTDGQTYSTRQIYDWICQSLGKPTPRWAVPIVVLKAAAVVGDVIGRLRGRPFFFNRDVLEKLIGSAWYSSEKITRELGYRPRFNLESTIPEIVEMGSAVPSKSLP